MRSVPNPFHPTRPSRSPSVPESAGLTTAFTRVVVYGGAAFVILNTMFLFGLHVPLASSSGGPATGTRVRSNMRQVPTTIKGNDQCSFRQYPPRRYYGLKKLEQPDFLSQVEYVYGQLPIMVLPDSGLVDHHQEGKLCVDQTDWLPPERNDPTKELPFADGTNPSILSLSRLEQSYPQLVKKWRSLGGAFIATICMTDSQCSYQDTPEEIKNFKVSQDARATVVQTLLLILDDRFRSLLQTTIYLEQDAPWGRKLKQEKPNGKGGFERTTRALDDARLFIHLNKLWVSYRDGPSFGYEQQVLNEIHMDLSPTNPGNAGTFTATLKATETATFCCGRNMALMEHLEDPTKLQSLTWADPVTVIDVDDRRQGSAITTSEQQQQQRRFLEEGKKRKSHFHGTNAFMVHLPDRDEFLGIGHFHRPSSRDAFNPYARFGHHYTHTFFTISGRPPFRLTRLSQEFVLPSKSKILQDDDADIIQFLSGLEVVKRDDDKEYAVIAYGINDCEAAAVYLGIDRVNELLRHVEIGKEVVDLMAPVEKR